MWLLRFIVANKITVLIPVLFVVLSLFEVAVACTEAGNRVDEVFEKSIPVSVDSGIHYIGAKITIGSPAGLFAFSLVCVSVSLLVAWHHHRITHKLKGYQRFLGSVRSLMEEAVNLSLSSADKRNTMTFIEQRGLQTLVVWSRKKDTHKFAAALLVTKDDGEYYQLERQWPPDTYTFPEGGIAGPCAAKRSDKTGSD